MKHIKLSSLTALTLATFPLLALAPPTACRAQGTANMLTNPTLGDTDGDKVPDGWRSSAPAQGETLRVANEEGGVRILDQDKNAGAGLAQYVKILPGHRYELSARARGGAGLSLILQFLTSRPAREGDINKHVIKEFRQAIPATPDFGEVKVTGMAPANATIARVWFYCPKIGVTDVTVASAALLDMGMVEGATGAAASPAGQDGVGGAVLTAPRPQPRPAGPAGGAAANAGGAGRQLANPGLKDEDGDGLPDGWRVFPDADGTGTIVTMAPGGGVRIQDSVKEKGIGILQQLAVEPGQTLKFTATLKSAGGIALNFLFLSDKPQRDSDLKQLLVDSKRIFGSGKPEGGDTTLEARVPASAKFVRVWLYSPNIGVTDVVVEKTALVISDAPAPVAVPVADARFLFKGDFETGDFEGWQTQFPKSTAGKIVADPVRAGKSALRSELTYEDFKTYGDSRNRRCEIYKEDVGQPGQERWYAFSIYLPRDWEDEVFDVVMQLHNHPDPGEGPKSPILTLETEGKNWKINNRWDKERISKPAKNGAGGTITSNRLWMGPYATEKWTDFVYHVKWSLEDDGLVEVWKDGEKVAEYKGPNCYNDEKPFYMKIGVYKPAYRVTAPARRILFHDEVRIGTEKATLADMAPAK